MEWRSETGTTGSVTGVDVPTVWPACVEIDDESSIAGGGVNNQHIRGQISDCHVIGGGTSRSTPTQSDGAAAQNRSGTGRSTRTGVARYWRNADGGDGKRRRTC